jgi:flagellar protein FlaI
MSDKNFELQERELESDEGGLDEVFEIYGVGGEEISQAIGQIWRAFLSGDDEARIDLRDAGRRWNRFKEERPEIGKWFWRMFYPLIFLIYSIMIIGVSSFSGEEMSVFLGESSFIGDILFLTVLFVGIGIFGLFAMSKVKGDEVDGGTFGLMLSLSKVLQVFTFVGLLSTFAVFVGREDTAVQWLSLANEYYSVVPGFPAFSISGVSGNLPLFAIIYALPYANRYFRARAAAIVAKKEDIPDPEMEEEEKSLEELVYWEGHGDVIDREFDMSVEEVVDVPDSLRREPVDGYKEVERYWLRVPYSYACILFNEEQSDYRYHVVQPEIDSEKGQLIMDEFRERLGTALLTEDLSEDLEKGKEEDRQKVQVLEKKLLELATQYDIRSDDRTFHKILYYIERDQVYHGKIDPLMNDRNIEDISCDGDNVPVFIFHREYKDLMTNISFSKDELRSFVIQLSQRSEEHISVADPLVDASLPDGSRAQLTLGKEVTDRGSTFTIRKFQDIPFTPVDLLRTGTFSLEQMAYIWLCIESNMSLIFAGGTASGKTTSLNAVSLFIPPKSKIVSIEDTRELSLPHQNWVPKKTRESFGVSGENIEMYELLRSALRQRPEYIIVGEIRGEEAQTLFQAMSTGHTTYSTMHAESVSSAVQRLENPPIDLPRSAISSLDILSIQSQVRKRNEETGEIENIRRNERIAEISGNRDRSGNMEFTRTPVFLRKEGKDEFVDKTNDSNVLDRIKRARDWTTEELEENLEERRKVLNYLLENNITDVKEVTRTIQVYMTNPKKTMRQIENDSLDPSRFDEITGIGFGKQEEIVEPEEVMLEEGDNNE